ncbi:hypothetical protein FPRO05_08458 [Fusarium proliferatum]|uniref:Carbohydrate-binding domain-containing protein n=1 Tax=Gibberella intermedia TaxID=948311 RepID=A0A365NJK8_GIBIN|nr:hypothetical protein FPRO05_08458 [Fusarium proliferatum]
MYSFVFLAIISLAAAHVPSVSVPSCPRSNRIAFSKSVPDQDPFPRTQIDLCYTSTALSLTFTALDEKSFYFNSSQGTNDDIWAYEVVEAFIYKGTKDPQTISNREEGAPFDHFFIADPEADGFEAETKLNRRAGTWVSKVKIPLGLFNVDPGCAKGTKWRMNFFRTVTNPKIFPDQELGGWSSPDKASFHITKFFGHVDFV